MTISSILKILVIPTLTAILVTSSVLPAQERRSLSQAVARAGGQPGTRH
jgi:hypothetical protein